jgi:hypothetical protein
MDRSGRSRVVALSLRCYPRRWRSRHAEEAAELAHLLIREGRPAVSIAWSYLAGATRERVVPLAFHARTIALLTTASLAGVSVVAWASPAPASAMGDVRAVISDPAVAAGQLNSTFRSHHFDITVREVAAPAGHAGSIVASWTTGPPGASNRILGEVKGTCADGSPGCTIGVVVPGNFAGTATVLIGSAEPNAR